MFSFLKQDKNGNLQDIFIEYAMTKNCLTNLAIEIGVNRISDVVAKCGFKIYSKNNEDISDFDYKLNVKPNPNQNATDFWKQAIHMMILKDDGCLIVNLKDNFYIADEWDCDDNVIKERTYSNVRIVMDDDEYIVNKKFKATDVVHLRYSNPMLMRLLKDSNKLVEQGWNVAINGFKSKAPKIKVSIPASLKLQDSNGNIVTSNEYAEKVANTLSQDDIKAIVSSSGIDISTIDTKNSLTSGDVEKLRNEVFTTTAIAFGIPKSVFNGEVTDNSNEFFTYACDPIIKIINNAMQGAWLEIDEYKNGDRIYVNCSSMKHIDVIESASNLDKLYCNGWSFNDVLDLLDKPRIDEDWADERRFTKNYSTDIEGVS